MKQLLLTISLILLSLSASADELDSLANQETSSNELAATEIIEADSLWDKANTAYINANYKEAVDFYHSIESQGLSSDKLFFNLGNAYYKSDDIARAILYYQKALLISPNDPDILYNLGVVQGQTKDQIEAVPEFFLRRWSRSISHILNCMGWSVISLVAVVIFLVSLLVFLLSATISHRKIGFGIGILSAIIFTISTLYAIDERREILEHNKAVVMSRSISIKSSPDHSSTELFILHSGTTVKIIRQMDDWYEIMIADGKKGWIESKRVETI